MLYLCSIYALSMLYLCSIHAPSMPLREGREGQEGQSMLHPCPVCALHAWL